MSIEMETKQSTPESNFLGITTTITKTDDVPEGPTQIEVVDDRPPEDRRAPKKAEPAKQDDDDEISSYSDKVQKRINKLRYEQHEERRQREAAERTREEAVRVAQQLAQQNRQYQEVISQGEAHLVAQVQSRAQIALDRAKENYRRVYESGDTDAILQAQEQVLQAYAEKREADYYDANYRERSVQQQYQQQQQQMAAEYQRQQRPVVEAPRPTELAKEWNAENPWFGDPKHKDMTALAYGIHERLIREQGVRPDTEEYFDAINREVRMRFPEYFDGESGDGGNAASTHRSSPTVVAPATRNNGGRPRKVKLNSTQVALAKRLGITLEQYAKQLVKEGN